MTSRAGSPSFDFTFGPYRLMQEQRCLLEGTTTVKLGSRAFDLLLALVERAGDVLSRRELEARVWPNAVVEETSLRVHMSALRRTLGDGRDGTRYIENIPGRGYCFVGPVRRLGADAPARHAPAPGAGRLIGRMIGRLIGRDEAMAALTAQLRDHRLVTLAGPGGIGKTTLALALAAQRTAREPEGAVFVDLTPLRDGSLIPATVAAALGLPHVSEEPLAALVQALAHSRRLVVLDNCEHMVAAAAELADTLLARTPVTLLATSREPLDVPGEWIHRLAPLALPPAGDPPAHDDALRFPAVDLFVERASAAGLAFMLTEENVGDVCALTRQLDGLPLALELVAARVASLGVVELRSRIGDHLSLLFRGRRTAAPRHQTLAAMLEWSYQLLSTPEQIVLRRLAVFRSAFHLEAASGVASSAPLTDEDVLQALIGLTAKSLVSVDTQDTRTLYRLLGTTRTFALRKLQEAEPLDPVARRHAMQMHRQLVAADAGRDGMLRATALTAHGVHIEDVRAALDWCFGDPGDLQVGIEIMAIALPLHELGVLAEHVDRIERALDHLQRLDPPRPDLELRLNLVLAWPSVEPGRHGPRTRAILARAAQRSHRLADATSRVLALYGAWLGSFIAGDYAAATTAAQSALAVASQAADEAGVALSERLLAQCRHFTGDHAAAREYAERTLSRDIDPMPAGYPSIVPRQISMRILLTRLLWLEGRPDSASRMADECLALAGDAHQHALLQTLAMAAIPLAFWRGDLPRADALVDRLSSLSSKSPSPYWASWAESFRAVLHADGRMPDPLPRNAKVLDCVASVAARWEHPASLERARTGACGWCAAEVLRQHGEALGLRGDAGGAAQAFGDAMALARRQGALGWELRAATSLARAWIDGGRVTEARALLAPLHDRYTEGLETADLRAARAILGG